MDFRCKFCSRKFAKKEHHARHLRTHTKERPFRCRQCAASFARKDTLSRHVRAYRHSTPSDPDEDPILTDFQQPWPGVEQNSAPEPGSSTLSDFTSLSQHAEDLHQTTPGRTEIITAPNHEDGLDEFGWRWSEVPELDFDFDIADVGTFNIDDAQVTLPWLPLRPQESSQVNGQELNKKDTPQSRDLYTQWFTHVSEQSKWVGLTATAEARDEISRMALASSIERQVPDTTLPSTTFLNQCINIFTSRLWPCIPVVHLPSFKPSTANPLLLLSICSLGALVHGSPGAIHHAVRLFNAVRRAILVSWDNASIADPNLIPILQASLIGQTFALFSARGPHLLTAQSLHGTICVVLRAFHSQMKRKRAANEPNFHLSGEELTKEWKLWVQEQIVTRLLNVLQIHDGELAAIRHQPPLLRTSWAGATMAAPDTIFLAKTAQEWQTLVLTVPPCPPLSTTSKTGGLQALNQYAPFSSLAVLELIMAEICDENVPSFGKAPIRDTSRLQNTLTSWFSNTTGVCRADISQRLSLQILWHSCFIHTFCDLNILEKACGRDGAEESKAAIQSIRAWASTDSARRCVAHALLLVKVLERFRIWDVPGLPVARAVFQAGLMLGAYAHFMPCGQRQSLSHDFLITFPEMGVLQDSKLFRAGDWDFVQDNLTAETCKEQACSVSAMLRHLAPWPNSRQYVDTLDKFLWPVEH